MTKNSLIDWVWTMDEMGIGWCQCEKDPITGKAPHTVNKPLVTKSIVNALGDIPELMSNQDISLVVLDLWKFRDITPPIAEALMRSVKAVNGEMHPQYPTATAMAAIKHFSNTFTRETAAVDGARG